MLKHAEPIQVLGQFGVQEKQPQRATDTLVFRRIKPYNANSVEVAQITPNEFIVQEGSVPPAHTIDFTDVSVTLQHYAVLFKLTSKAELMYEDDIPNAMVKLTGETIAEIAEKLAYGAFKGGTQVVYANGSSRAAVNTPISLRMLENISRVLDNNRAKNVTEAIKPGPNFDTRGVDPAKLVFCSSDCVSDIKKIPGFTKRVDYGSSIKPAHENEFGAIDDFRFIKSPLFAPYLAAGAAVGTSGMKAADDTNIDVYPILVMAADAWGHVSLKGKEHIGISPTILSSKTKTHANPAGTFGFVGGDFWYQPVRLNEHWMVRGEVAVTDLE